MVLLKNAEGVLPLNRQRIKTVAVLGPDAFPAVVGGGGSSLTKPYSEVSFLEGISNYLGTQVKVLHLEDALPLEEIFENTEFTTAAPDSTSGLKGEYFSNDGLQGAPVSHPHRPACALRLGRRQLRRRATRRSFFRSLDRVFQTEEDGRLQIS